MAMAGPVPGDGKAKTKASEHEFQLSSIVRIATLVEPLLECL